MSNELTVELNDSQCDIYDRLHGSDYIYEIGGRYSGKTYGILQMMVLIGLMYSGYRWVIFRKVYASIKDSVYEELKGVIEDMKLREATEAAGFQWDGALKSPLYIPLPNGSDFIFKGMDSTEKSKGLARCHGAFLEELNEFTSMDFETIDNGIRGKGLPHYFFMAHNPVPQISGSQYWFQRMFGEMKERGKVIPFDHPELGKVLKLKTSYLDNKFCPEKRRRRLESYKTTNPDLYKLWACGDYAEMKGVIFSNWDTVSRVPSGVDCIGFGLDFGFSQDPAACVQVWANSTDIWVKGILYSTDLTNTDLYDMLISRGVDAYGTVIADSAEPKSIQDLYDRGLWNIDGVTKRKNYKAEMANILKGYSIHLVEGDTDLQREFGTWSWDEDKTGKLLPKPKDGNDHYIDAFIMVCSEKIADSDTVLY